MEKNILKFFEDAPEALDEAELTKVNELADEFTFLAQFASGDGKRGKNTPLALWNDGKLQRNKFLIFFFVKQNLKSSLLHPPLRRGEGKSEQPLSQVGHCTKLPNLFVLIPFSIFALALI